MKPNTDLLNPAGNGTVGLNQLLDRYHDFRSAGLTIKARAMVGQQITETNPRVAGL